VIVVFMLLFAPLTALVYGWMALGHVTYVGLLIGMSVAMLAFRLVMAAYQADCARAQER